MILRRPLREPGARREIAAPKPEPWAARHERLEDARQADAEWRGRQHARREARIARFPRYYQGGTALAMCCWIAVWNAFARGVESHPGLLPPGWEYSRVALDVGGIFVGGLLVGLWSTAAYGWLERRKKELTMYVAKDEQRLDREVPTDGPCSG